MKYSVHDPEAMGSNASRAKLEVNSPSVYIKLQPQNIITEENLEDRVCDLCKSVEDSIYSDVTIDL